MQLQGSSNGLSSPGKDHRHTQTNMDMINQVTDAGAGQMEWQQIKQIKSQMTEYLA